MCESANTDYFENHKLSIGLEVSPQKFPLKLRGGTQLSFVNKFNDNKKTHKTLDTRDNSPSDSSTSSIEDERNMKHQNKKKQKYEKLRIVNSRPQSHFRLQIHSNKFSPNKKIFLEQRQGFLNFGRSFSIGTKFERNRGGSHLNQNIIDFNIKRALSISKQISQTKMNNSVISAIDRKSSVPDSYFNQTHREEHPIQPSSNIEAFLNKSPSIIPAANTSSSSIVKEQQFLMKLKKNREVILKQVKEQKELDEFIKIEQESCSSSAFKIKKQLQFVSHRNSIFQTAEKDQPSNNNDQYKQNIKQAEKQINILKGLLILRESQIIKRQEASQILLKNIAFKRMKCFSKEECRRVINKVTENLESGQDDLVTSNRQQTHDKIERIINILKSIQNNTYDLEELEF